LIGDAYTKALGDTPVPQAVGDSVMERALQITDKNYDASMPESVRGRVLDFVENGVLSRFDQGRITPQTWKEIDSKMGREAAGFKSSPDPDMRRLGQAYSDLQAQWRESMTGLLPAEDSARLQQANAAYRDLLRAEKAGSYAGRDQGVISPARLARAESTMAPKRPTGGRKIPEGEMADFARTGQDVLGNQIPDSGTAGRMLLPLALGGEGLSALLVPKIGMGLVAGTAAYSRPGARLLTGHMKLPGTSKEIDPEMVNAILRGINERPAQ
jgi:hypothetical protein